MGEGQSKGKITQPPFGGDSRTDLLERALLSITEGVLLTDSDGQITLDTLPFEVRDALAAGEIPRNGLDISRTNGTQMHVIRQTLSDGGVMVVVRDVTSQRRAEEELQAAIHTDPVTGGPNLLAVRLRGAEAFQVSRRYGNALSVMRVEIEDGDRYESKELSDAVRKHVNQICRHALRSADMVACTGPTSFVVLMPETDAPGAAIVAERLIDKIQRSGLLFQGQSVDPTITTGLATFENSVAEFETLLEKAEADLIN